MRLEVDPFPKERPRVNRKTGGIYTPRPTVAAEREVRGLLAQQWHGPVLTVPVAVRLELHTPRARGDLDNYCKLILDAAKGVIWKDDRQVVELHASMVDGAPVGLVFLEVAPDSEVLPATVCASCERVGSDL